MTLKTDSTLEGYVMIVLVAVGIPLNSLVMITLIVKHKLHEPQFLLYTILSFWNLVDIILVMVPMISTWFKGEWIYGYAFCSVKVVFYIICFYITFVTMVTIVVDRYIFIKQPLHFNNQDAVTRIKKYLGFLYVVGCLSEITAASLLSTNNMNSTVTGQICTPKFSKPILERINGIGLILFVLLPTVMECCIAQKTFKVVLYHMQHEFFNSCCRRNRKSIRHLITCRNHRIIKAATIIFIITISNSVALLPFSVYTGLSLTMTIQLDENLYNGFVILMFFNVVLNPLVCLTINSRLRRIISSMGRRAPVYPECSFTSSNARTRHYSTQSMGLRKDSDKTMLSFNNGTSSNEAVNVNNSFCQSV